MREFSRPGSEEKVLVAINHALDNTFTTEAGQGTTFIIRLPLR